MVKPITQYYDVIINAPFGGVGIHVESDYVVGIQLFPIQQSTREASHQFAQYVAHQISQYFMQAGSILDIPYAVSGTPFQKRVWKAISDIPAGEVLTYSELAEKVGSGPRAVANACGANRLPLLIPCHRVVAKNGLGGFMQGIDGGLKIKEWLLAHESK
jgi:methylated-DNA-[protein]-cysteine S-methyltransferase